MMNRRRLMISTMLMSAVGAGVVGMVGFGGSAWAAEEQCIVPPNCADLGYTSSSFCDNGIKCLWGETWYCPPEKSKFCDVGNILYSDMTCSAEVKTGKTPIGVVVYTDGAGYGQAMALKFAGNGNTYMWGNIKGKYSVNLADLPDLELNQAYLDYSSYENTAKILVHGDKTIHPAVWIANEYSAEGTKAGDWSLPAVGIFSSYYSNQELIDKALAMVGAGDISNAISGVWSSTECDAFYMWAPSEDNNSLASKDNSYKVLPVFEFFETFSGMCQGKYRYICQGEHETGGVGDVCAGKYSECSCAEGYEWWLGKCLNPRETIGSILYSDKTVSMALQNGKTPIGVVVYVDGNGGGQAMALDTVGSYVWSDSSVDIAGLPNLSLSDASKDYNSCENTKIITAKGDSTKYPAAWAAYDYSTEGTSTGDWCLPAGGIIKMMYNNRDAVNSGVYRASGAALVYPSDYYTWSSTEHYDKRAWYCYSSSCLSTDTYRGRKTNSYYVYPVIEF